MTRHRTTSSTQAARPVPRSDLRSNPAIPGLSEHPVVEIPDGDNLHAVIKGDLDSEAAEALAAQDFDALYNNGYLYNLSKPDPLIPSRHVYIASHELDRARNSTIRHPYWQVFNIAMYTKKIIGEYRPIAAALGSTSYVRNRCESLYNEMSENLATAEEHVYDVLSHTRPNADVETINMHLYPARLGVMGVIDTFFKFADAVRKENAPDIVEATRKQDVTAREEYDQRREQQQAEQARQTASDTEEVIDVMKRMQAKRAKAASLLRSNPEKHYGFDPDVTLTPSDLYHMKEEKFFAALWRKFNPTGKNEPFDMYDGRWPEECRRKRRIGFFFDDLDRDDRYYITLATAKMIRLARKLVPYLPSFVQMDIKDNGLTNYTALFNRIERESYDMIQRLGEVEDYRAKFDYTTRVATNDELEWVSSMLWLADDLYRVNFPPLHEWFRLDKEYTKWEESERRKAATNAAIIAHKEKVAAMASAMATEDAIDVMKRMLAKRAKMAKLTRDNPSKQ